MSGGKGEKGSKGDTGSRGAQGTAGTRGAAGADAPFPRRQVLTGFLLLSAFFILTAFWQQAQTSGLKNAQRAAVAECQAINAGNAQFNKVLDQLAKNAQRSTALTAAQKAEAIKTYASVHLPTLVCTGLAP